MQYGKHRFYEILPGALVWGTLIVSCYLSYFDPLLMIYFVILFDLYWLLRILYFVPFLLISWWRYRSALKRDWQKEIETLPGYDAVRQLIFLPTYKEEEAVVRETLQVLSSSPFPSDRVFIVLAGEERDRTNFLKMAEALHREFDTVFGKFFVTVHPMGRADEIPGKGSNLHYAAQEVVPKLLAEGIDPDHVVVSAFDVDMIVHPQYFSCLTYHFLTVPEPTRSSYQPVALYNNNLWESPAAVRVAMFGTTFWLMNRTRAAGRDDDVLLTLDELAHAY